MLLLFILITSDGVTPSENIRPLEESNIFVFISRWSCEKVNRSLLSSDRQKKIQDECQLISRFYPATIWRRCEFDTLCVYVFFYAVFVLLLSRSRMPHNWIIKRILMTKLKHFSLLFSSLAGWNAFRSLSSSIGGEWRARVSHSPQLNSSGKERNAIQLKRFFMSG